MHTMYKMHKPPLESIHSGHFMVSQLDDDEENNNDCDDSSEQGEENASSVEYDTTSKAIKDINFRVDNPLNAEANEHLTNWNDLDKPNNKQQQYIVYYANRDKTGDSIGDIHPATSSILTSTAVVLPNTNYELDSSGNSLLNNSSTNESSKSRRDLVRSISLGNSTTAKMLRQNQVHNQSAASSLLSMQNRLQQQIQHQNSPHQPHVFIDATLTKLLECMSLYYSSKLTSPKWKSFKGSNLRLKKKIRLNNLIWRAWFLQYIRGRQPPGCQFITAAEPDVHKKAETIVLEGKYWKRKVDAIVHEYSKWRRFQKQKIHMNCFRPSSFDWDSRVSNLNSYNCAFYPDYEINNTYTFDELPPMLEDIETREDIYYSPLTSNAAVAAAALVTTQTTTATTTNNSSLVNNLASKSSSNLPQQVATSSLSLKRECQPIASTSNASILPSPSKIASNGNRLYALPSNQNQPHVPQQLSQQQNSIAARKIQQHQSLISRQQQQQQVVSTSTALTNIAQHSLTTQTTSSPSTLRTETITRKDYGDQKQTSQQNTINNLMTPAQQLTNYKSNNSTSTTQFYNSTQDHHQQQQQAQLLHMNQLQRPQNLSMQQQLDNQFQMQGSQNVQAMQISPSPSFMKLNMQDNNLCTTNMDRDFYSPSASSIGFGGDSRNEQRRACHINAEQKRRCNIKNGFDTLKSILPSINQNINLKISKAAMLQRAAHYIQTLDAEKEQQTNEAYLLRKRIESLKQEISSYQYQLPASGVPVGCQGYNRAKEMLEEYIQKRTVENWRFWVFSLFIEPLFNSYYSSVNTSSLEEAFKTIIIWLNQCCSLMSLRKNALESLTFLSTNTNVLNMPQTLPNEAVDAVYYKNLRSSTSTAASPTSSSLTLSSIQAMATTSQQSSSATTPTENMHSLPQCFESLQLPISAAQSVLQQQSLQQSLSQMPATSQAHFSAKHQQHFQQVPNLNIHRWHP